MKKFIAFTLMLVLILACLSPALAANNQLSAASHGGKAQSGYVEKIKTGNPSITVNSINNLNEGLKFYFRVRYKDGTAATHHYDFDETGVRTVRYKNDDIRNDVGASFFIRIQIRRSLQFHSVTGRAPTVSPPLSINLSTDIIPQAVLIVKILT